MKKVLLINQDNVPNYRIPVYNYLAAYLQREKYALTVVSCGAQYGTPHNIQFNHKEISLSFLRLTSLIRELDPDVIIYWLRLRHLYLFPTLLLIKILRKKAIYWGHGSDLHNKTSMRLKTVAKNIKYRLSDALILYGEHLKKNVKNQFHHKTFIANNTLYFNKYKKKHIDKRTLLSKYNIKTAKNIICMGRMQKRKRLDSLFSAFELLDSRDIGLILIGPDTDGILRDVHLDNIYKLGPIFGDERLDLLFAADVFCLPGAVGLSIVDAFYCGLPIVTEDGDESPEMMYLKNGVNGFIVPRGDVKQLSDKLQLLLDDDVMRERFSLEARKEIFTTGHIDKMCKGFTAALRSVC